jgi:hypothetical protein
MNRLSAALVEFRISSLRIFSFAHKGHTDGCITIPDHNPQCMNEVGKSGQVRANQRGFQLLLRCLYRSASDRTDPTTPLVTNLTRDCSHVFLSLKTSTLLFAVISGFQKDLFQIQIVVAAASASDLIKTEVRRSDWPVSSATLLWREPIPVRHRCPHPRVERSNIHFE